MTIALRSQSCRKIIISSFEHVYIYDAILEKEKVVQKEGSLHFYLVIILLFFGLLRDQP